MTAVVLAIAFLFGVKRISISDKLLLPPNVYLPLGGGDVRHQSQRALKFALLIRSATRSTAGQFISGFISGYICMTWNPYQEYSCYGTDLAQIIPVFSNQYRSILQYEQIPYDNLPKRFSHSNLFSSGLTVGDTPPILQILKLGKSCDTLIYFRLFPYDLEPLVGKVFSWPRFHILQQLSIFILLRIEPLWTPIGPKRFLH